MRIIKVWIFSFSGQQLFCKEYEDCSIPVQDRPQDSFMTNMLNTGVVHSFLNFFNSHVVKKYCDLMMFDDILFTFYYMFEDTLKFITLIITQIDKKIELEVQTHVLQKVARSISCDFSESYKEVMGDLQVNLNIFKPFEERCDQILHDIAGELETDLKEQRIKINGF
ncbi:MAG TPA: hypothetical protein VMV49_05255 [Candidatus Deferrimicrobium sp.]|nr:hypothetical protein [Candidatus Deferrimicrobium sp.]